MKPSHRELHRLVAVTVGVVLVVWAVADVLPWLERVALAVGVALIAHGLPFIILTDGNARS
ncbi:MAG: hypothetical protein AMS18_05590 [Gemmatimonas sp. SG8_17]|nr:MAG: hypothetical protein AMS18_05590 [Gemmatimonas sp. SG8_17]